MPDKIDDGLIRVEDKIYSAEKLANFHPGGPLFVKVLYIQGFKGSKCFNSQTHKYPLRLEKL